MLGIIPEFDHVEMAVAAFEQMRLRAAAHLPDQACGWNQHKEGKGLFYGTWLLAPGCWTLEFAGPFQKRMND
jgi:hypothetical protein